MKNIQVAICDSNPKDRDNFVAKCRNWSTKYGISMDFILYEHSNLLLLDVERSQDKEKLFNVLLLEVNDDYSESIATAIKLRMQGYVGQIIFIDNGCGKDEVPKEAIEKIFAAQGADYMTKESNRFEEILHRVIAIIQEEETEYVLYNRVGEYRQIALHDIRYFDVHKNLVCVHFNDKKFEFLSTLTKVYTQLSERGFYRIHRTCVVSFSHVRSVNNTEVELSCGTKLPIGRSTVEPFRKALSNYKRIVSREGR